MKERIYDCVCELVGDIAEYLEDHEYVTCIAKYDEAKIIIKELLSFNEKSYINFIDIEPLALDGYDDEFFIDIDKDLGICCERAIIDSRGGYLNYDSEVVFVHNDCRYNVVSANLNDEPEVIAFEIYKEDDEECCCDDCDKCDNGLSILTDDDDSIIGFRYSYKDETGERTYSYMNSDPEMVMDVLEAFLG